MTDAEDDIDLSMGAIHLSEEEAAPIVIVASDDSDRLRNNCLIGKILSGRDQDVRSVRAALRQSWGCNFNLIRLEQNVFQIVFENHQDMTRVYTNSPWCFANILISLQQWVDDWEKRLDYFAITEFWVHVINLPFHVYTEGVGKQVAEALKATSDCQLRVEQPSGKRFFRLRIPVNLCRSLRRFVSLIINGVELQGKLQFERLPHICGQCGMWNHTVSACTLISKELTEEERSRLPYGEKQGWKAARRSTLIKEFQPGQMSGLRARPHLTDIVSTPPPLQEEVSAREFNNTNHGGNENREELTSAIIGGGNIQLVVNFPIASAPGVSALLHQLMHMRVSSSGLDSGSWPLEYTERGHMVTTNDVESSRSIRTWSRRPRLQVLSGDDHSNHSEQGSRNGDVLKHIVTREHTDMERKRKTKDVVVGESSLKKTRLLISEPLVESAESQAHLAP